MKLKEQPKVEDLSRRLRSLDDAIKDYETHFQQPEQTTDRK